MGLITKLFGTRSQRELKKIQPMVDAILALESQYKQMPEEELKGKTAEFRARLEKGEGLEKREDNFADEVASMIK